MNKTELLDKCARDGEERLLLARTLDKLDAARLRSIPGCTPFLSPSQRAAVEALLNVCPPAGHLFFGGYEGAERTVCAFLPDWLEEEDYLAGEDCPIRALRCTYPQDAPLTHRDFLGAILGLGLDREKVGDLLLSPGSCDILVLQEVEPLLLRELSAAGRTPLKCRSIPLSAICPRPPEIKLIHDTVSTLRLDAVAASAFSLSRAKAADAISSGRVQLNHRECLKPDRPVAQGDVLSCRGLGKCVVKPVGGLSKKGRVIIELERYL